MNAPIDVTNIRIETERLILRPWRLEDLDDFFEYARVDGVGQMAGWQPHENREKSLQILQFFIQEKKTFALELKENHKVIGSLGLEKLDPEAAAEEKVGREVGYVLSKDYWGRGLMPEAVRAIVAYCFDMLQYDFMVCGHFAWNNQSRRVIEKSGFTFWKEVKHETRYGTVEDTLLYRRERA
ncbi:MAG: GNAT family N-acetyltransferase [Faecousia sp.]